MKRLFVYSPLMLKRLADFTAPEEVALGMENEILNNPESGDIVPGTGGVRKFRLADEARGKGRRGGIRVFFLDLPHVEKTHLLYLLQKGDASDITTAEKRALRELVLILKRESKP
jgi:hypothetical protein